MLVLIISSAFAATDSFRVMASPYASTLATSTIPNKLHILSGYGFGGIFEWNHKMNTGFAFGIDAGFNSYVKKNTPRLTDIFGFAKFGVEGEIFYAYIKAGADQFIFLKDKSGAFSYGMEGGVKFKYERNTVNVGISGIATFDRHASGHDTYLKVTPYIGIESNIE